MPIFIVSVAGNRFPAPNMWKFLLSPSPRIYLHVSRIPLNEIPVESEKATLSWLHSRFELKDNLISQHFGLNNIEDDSEATSLLTHDVLRGGILSTLPLRRTLPSALFLTSFTVLLLTTQTGRMAYFTSLVGGSVLTVLYSKIFF